MAYGKKKYKVHKLHQMCTLACQVRATVREDVPLVEFTYLVFKNTRMPGESWRMYLRWSLRTLYLQACQVRVTVGDSGLCLNIVLLQPVVCLLLYFLLLLLFSISLLTPDEDSLSKALVFNCSSRFVI